MSGFYHFHKHLIRAFDDGSKSNAICKIKEEEYLVKENDKFYDSLSAYDISEFSNNNTKNLDVLSGNDNLRKQKLAYNVYKISTWLISLKLLHEFKYEDDYSVKMYYATDYTMICVHSIIIHDTDSWREKKDIISEHLACIWYYEKIERERRLTLDEITEQSKWLSSIFKRKGQ